MCLYSPRAGMCVSQLYLLAWVCAVTVGRIKVFYGISMRHPWRWHLLYTIPVTGSLGLVPPFHCFSAPFLFRFLMLSLNHHPFPCLFSYPSSPIIFLHIALSPDPSKHYLCAPSPLPLIPHHTPTAFDVVMMHSGTVFISASSRSVSVYIWISEVLFLEEL